MVLSGQHCYFVGPAWATIGSQQVWWQQSSKQPMRVVCVANEVRFAWRQQHEMTREVPISRSKIGDAGLQCGRFGGDNRG